MVVEDLVNFEHKNFSAFRNSFLSLSRFRLLGHFYAIHLFSDNSIWKR